MFAVDIKKNREYEGCYSCQVNNHINDPLPYSNVHVICVLHDSIQCYRCVYVCGGTGVGGGVCTPLPKVTNVLNVPVNGTCYQKVVYVGKHKGQPSISLVH